MFFYFTSHLYHFLSSAPFLFLAPFSMLAFHILGNASYQQYLLYVFLFFVVWTQFRMANGIRILFTTNSRKVLIILLLSYCIPFLIFFAILRPGPYWYDYVKFLIAAKGFF